MTQDVDSRGLVDVHIHLLPGLDDGPGDWDTSLAMARQALAAGTRTVVATPHLRPGAPGSVEPRFVSERVDELRARLEAAGLPLTVLPGAELYPVPELARWLEAQEHPGMGLALERRYVLVDLPLDLVPPYFEELMFSVRLVGLTPILAHPERNRVLATHVERVEALVGQGALAQVTAGSLLGDFGTSAQQAAWRLVETGVAQLVASDAHGLRTRSPQRLGAAFEAISRRAGAARAAALCREVPKAVALGHHVEGLLQAAAGEAAPGLAGRGRRRVKWWAGIVARIGGALQ